jgi:hypothetical protein
MADIAELGIKIDTSQLTKAKVAQLEMVAAAKKLEASESDLSIINKKLEATNKALAASTNLVERETLQANAAQLSAKKSALDVSIANQKLALSSGAATKAGGGFANSLRQVSLQLSQVAQQGAVTGDFFRAFTVQLPDLLLGFGTFAILIGAAAGALGGPLIDALTGSSKAIKNVDEDIADLTDGFEELTDAQRAYVLLSSEIKQADLQKEFDDIGQEVKAAADELKILEQGFRRTARGQRISIAADPEEIQEAELALKRLSAVRDNIGLKLEREIKLQGELRDATDLTTQSALEANRAQSKTDLLSELEATTDAIERAGSTQTELAVRAAAERNSILAAAYNEDLISFGEYQEQRVNNQLNLQAELTEIDEKAQQQRNQILTAGQEAALSASGQLFGNLASIAKEGGEDQFQEYKNLASAQAAIAASLAAIKALAEGGPILGPALAVSIGAVAAIQIAKIQGQEYQSSRASGGQATGRVLVGENGPEILNMGNSTGKITSAAGTKNEMQGQTVQQIFNISPGLSGLVQAEIQRAIPLMAKVAVSSVSGDIRRGGSAAKAVGIR